MTKGTVDKPQLGLRRIIERPRLTRLLDESPARIKMLVAPAGYGKTTLARQWLRSLTQPVAWFTATPSSVDVAALAMGLHRAVATARPGIGRVLLERLPVTANPQADIEVLADLLVDDFGSWSPEEWLVIDDYQEIVGVTASERFVEILLLSSPINLLVLTRERPSWASARRILYGEISECGRDALAMNREEAIELVSSPDVAHSDLLETTGGWPAALALAAISPSAPQDVTIASALHRFFAEELYQRIDEQTRRDLWEIALIAPAHRAMIIRMLGSEASRAIEIGCQHGFLTQRDLELIEVHPLLKNFLEDKLRQEASNYFEVLIERVFDHFLEDELWDEAFDIIDRFELPTLLPRLLLSSLSELLALGRTETLRRWIARGGASVTDPIVGLTSAELAFREGHYYASEVLAESAAASCVDNVDIAARALIVAGRSAHAASREQEALSLYSRAKEHDTSGELKRVALMGELLAATELEHPEALALAETIEPDDLLPHERVILIGRLLVLQTRFALPVDLEAGRAARQLLHLVDDPLARCSFRNVLGYVLAACGRCDEALDMTEDQLRDADRCRLDFIVPYALCVRALGQAGQRYFHEAEENLAKAEQLALRSGDRTASMISRCLAVRVLIAQGGFSQAVVHPPRTLGLTNSLASELLASHALARAGAGDIEKAFEQAALADQMSGATETRICAPAARAVAELRAGRTAIAQGHALEALEIATTTGMIEPFVAAYRGCPELVTCLLQDNSVHESITNIIAMSGDHWMQINTQAQSVATLSPREKEVLGLLGLGLTNSEIAAKLFISPATVKVHVHHIFEKLGVASRTAAALRAIQIGRDQAAPDATRDGSR